jgi:RNA polymerase-binding transcription factor
MNAVKKKTKTKPARATKAANITRTAKPAKAVRSSVAPREAALPKAVPSKAVLPKAASSKGGRPVVAAPLKSAPPPPPRPAPPVIGAKQLDNFRRLLHERKRGLSEMYNRNKTYGRLTEDEGTQDLADKASSAYTKEFLYSLSNTDREVLQKVDEALVRLETGGFGQCLECGAEINRKRLEAVPWASHCIVCQEKREKGLL